MAPYVLYMWDYALEWILVDGESIMKEPELLWTLRVLLILGLTLKSAVSSSLEHLGS